MGEEKKKEIFVVGSKKFFGSVIRKEKGFFCLDEFYKAWRDWFADHKYFVNEKGITEKHTPKEILEMKIEWISRRDITGYVRYHIDIFLWARRLRDVIIKVKDKKKQVQTGDLYIGFKGYMEKDYKGTWKKHEFLRQMHDRFLIKQKLLAYKYKIYKETNDLIALTKKHCGMMPLVKE